MAPPLPALDEALSYARRGWRVLPLYTWRIDACACGEDCASPAKHPHTDLVLHGLHQATCDVDRVHDWWSRFPTANVGVATGADSGLVVIDVDGAVGFESLDALEAQHGALPPTLRAYTGGGGMHYLFRHPGVPVRNSAGTKLGAGVDVRGDAGYIVAAPSLHRSGERYRWMDPSEDLAELPAWLLDLVKEPERPDPASRPALSVVRSGEGSAYGLEALEREVAGLAATGQGGRNHALNAAAFALGQLVAGGELPEQLVVEHLSAAALSIGLTGKEIEATLRSGLRKGSEQPRTAPAHEPSKVTPMRRRSAGNGSAPPPAGPSRPAEPPDEPDLDHELTDLGNARRLVARYGDRFRHVPQWNTWLAWDGVRWHRDTTGEVQRAAKACVELIVAEALMQGSEGRRDAYRKWALKSQSSERLNAVVKVASTEPGIPVEPHQLDADPWLLTCLNGTIDLRTGDLGPHRPEHLITKLAPVAYDPRATSERWEGFLAETTGGDEELTSFLQRAAGYSLTGDTSEEKLFFLHGPPAAGKSTFVDAMQAVLGDYGLTADFQTFLDQPGSSGARSDIARLAGARLVASIEVDDGKRLAEGLVKSLTGGDRITARYLYGNEFEFRPAFKLWLAANFAPRVQHADEAMWRRILRIPFEHMVPVERRDPALKAYLRDASAAGPAVLAWAVKGCLEWRRRGLGVPRAVDQATQDYRDEQDPLRDFLEDRCILGDGMFAGSGDLYHAYSAWAKDAGIRRPMSQRSLGDTLSAQGFESRIRRLGSRPMRGWDGIGLVSDRTDPDPESQQELWDTSVTALQRNDEGPVLRSDPDTALHPEPPAQSTEIGGRNAVTQRSDPSRDARAGEKVSGTGLHSVTALHPWSDWPIDEHGWRWGPPGSIAGECVGCHEPCRSVDPEGRTRHDTCRPPRESP